MIGRRSLAGVGLLLVALSGAPNLRAQAPDDHAAHHPPAGGDAAGSREEMGGMEREMQTPAPMPEPIYPFLMRFPDLTAEARLQVQQRADREELEGLAALSAAVEAARDAARSGDPEAGARATVAVREAGARLEAAWAVRRVVQQGRPPREAAMEWFRREMSLGAPGTRGGLPAVSPWRHRAGILALAAVALLLAVSFAVRVRRASKMLARLAEPAEDEGLDG